MPTSTSASPCKTRGSWRRRSPNTATAIRIKPDYAEAHINLGIALQAQGKPEEAIAAYRAAIRLKPDFAEAHNNLGLALTDQGKLEEAIAEFRDGDPAQARLRRRPQQPRHRPASPGEAGGGDRRIPRGDPAQARRRRGPHQPRHRPARPGEAGGGDRRIPHGDPAQARLRRGPLQPRHRPASPGEAGGGDRRIPHGDPARARRRRGPQQPGLGAGPLPQAAAAAITRKVCDTPARPSSYAEGRKLANTLALAEYRSGHWAESLAASERSMALRERRGTPTTGSSWPWPTGRKVTRTRPAIGSTRPSPGPRRGPRERRSRQFWAEAAELLGQPGPDADGAGPSAAPAAEAPR